MRARAFIGTLLLIVLALCANHVFSQIPQGFNYQAVIRDGSGNPLANKNVSLKITLQSATATAYYTESKTLTTTGQGVIKYTVGNGTVSFGTFASIPWNSGDIYLKVEVDPNGGSSYTQLGDPSKLQSVPYALYANGLQGTAGTNGTNGISIQWLGSLATAPSSPTLNQAYYNSTDKISYVYNGSAWNILAQDGAVGPQGPQGSPGTGLTNRGSWSSSTSYVNGDYVFDRSTGSPSINSMWICQVAVGPVATQPYQDAAHWVEFQAPAGPQGIQGVAGNPGSNGISIQWLGTLAAAPGSPSLNQAYYNSTDKKSYVWNGSAWNTLAVDGVNGTNGTNGTNGNNGISIQWLGTLASAPGSPTLDQAYYNSTDKKSYIWNGTAWNILTQDGIPISGSTGQTLYYNGTAWTPTSTLYNNSTNVGIGTTSPTQKLDVSGSIRLRGTLYDYSNSAGSANQLLTNGGSGVLWSSLPTIGIPTGSGTSGQLALWSGTNSLQGVSNLAWGTTSLQITSPTSAGTDDPILEVKNKDGKVVLGVYQGGVRIYVEDSPIVKGAKGGFAIGGLTNQAKSGPAEYMRITSDSARIYINESTAKGAKGGFAIGGLTNQAKTITSRNIMYVAPDSTRIYVNENPTKGAKGGFAIGGLTNQGKGGKANYFDIETGDKYIINPSQARILWYPLKNAFLTGEVLVKDPNDVGLNSFASGYQSKAKGQYSQALGFQAVALGDYSTAIGKNATANYNNSFAFGDSSVTSNENSYAFGKLSKANGLSSYAFGEGVIAGSSSSGNCYALGKQSKATGDGSYAFGDGAQATGLKSYAFGSFGQDGFTFPTGTNTIASGNNSFAAGQGAVASANNAVSIGFCTKAWGNNAVALGFGSIAGDQHSGVAIGEYANASGYCSVAMGFWASASNVASVALGAATIASGYSSTSLGYYTYANADFSVAIGRGNLGLTNSLFEIGNGTSSWGGTGVRSNAFTILNNGMTGINCVPSAGLDVNGTENSPQEAAIQNTRANYPQLILKATSGGDNAKIWRMVGRSTNDFEIQTLDDNYQNEVTAMQINRSGKDVLNVAFPNGSIGIGTTSPSYSVENYGINASFIAHYYSNTRGGLSALTNQRLAVLTTSSNDNLVFGYSSSTFQSFFSTNFVERMRIVNSTGNVGIGTNNPLSNLEVKVTGGNGFAGIGINKDGGKNITLNQGTSGRLNFTVPGEVDLVTFDFVNKLVGINNTSPSYPLQVGVYGSGVNGNGAYLTAGGTWTGGSSRTFKDRFTSLNIADILLKIEGIDIRGWYYKKTNEYHIGPVAEDFYDAFGTGDKNSPTVNKYLSPSDVAGVTMIAVKELIKQNEGQKQKIEKLQDEIDDLKSELEQIKAMLKK